jgi:hypothetical protein
MNDPQSTTTKATKVKAVSNRRPGGTPSDPQESARQKAKQEQQLKMRTIKRQHKDLQMGSTNTGSLAQEPVSGAAMDVEVDCEEEHGPEEEPGCKDGSVIVPKGK